MKEVRKELVKLSTRTRDADVRGEISAFLMILSEDHMRMSAMGLFHVGTHLIPGVSIHSINGS